MAAKAKAKLHPVEPRSTGQLGNLHPETAILECVVLKVYWLNLTLESVPHQIPSGMLNPSHQQSWWLSNHLLFLSHALPSQALMYSPSSLCTPVLFPSFQVYWLGPILGAVLAGVAYEFFFASSASRDKLVACLTCRDIEIVEAASVSRSSLSAPSHAKPSCKGEHSPE